NTARLTYAALEAEVRRTAAGMRGMGIGKGDHVAILMGNDEKWLTLFYAAASIGAVTVPVNTRFKAAELKFCLEQADSKALFYTGKFLGIDYAAMIGEVRPQLPELARVYDVDGGLPSGEPAPGPAVSPG